VTEVTPVSDFWEAEPEHQDYIERYPNGYTCDFPRPNWTLPKRGTSPRGVGRRTLQFLLGQFPESVRDRARTVQRCGGIADRVTSKAGLGCDVFCTCDRRTVVRKRQHLRQLPIRIITPAEWWAHIKPWAGLWG
jgi:hypothetical protein